MAPVQSCIESHQRTNEQSARILQTAREDAKKTKYDSNATQDIICKEFHARFNNHIPYDWQLDVAEALVLGLDCSVIAGTGAGKTMPFIMPLFAEPSKHVLIISPLNALEEDQARQFNEMGLCAVAVNGETYSDALHKDLKSRKYRVILTSPEMCLKDDRFRQILGNPKFSSHLAAIVIDEAHCISQWGDKFRDEYSKLGTIRALIPSRVPFLVTSATLPPLVLAQVCTTVHIQTSVSYHVDIGIDRPNISWECRRMKGAISDLQSLCFLLPKSCGGDGKEGELQQGLVFGDNINELMMGMKFLHENAPEHLRHQIVCYNSHRITCSKCLVLRLYREGRIKILFTTEAAGMGCDMPHIEIVVQFMVLKSLSIWMQRAGRAGRSPSMQASAILLVQPSVFQEKNKKKKDPDKPGQMEYVKMVDEPLFRNTLRAWIEAMECRRDVADEYFNSGVKRKCTYTVHSIWYLCASPIASSHRCLL
ncbi:P-loop containing nucleoside triphosphate hydrolase protein [Melanogaster broomeanus]|nr:P-loop containing nucleoside triphosphate hydrolase protein [Melanogaster broomeanus]